VQLYRAAGVTAVPVISLHLQNEPPARDTLRALRASAAARALHEGGATIAVGVDASGDRTPFVHDELQALVAAGLPPAAVLRAATRDAAVALGAGEQLGRIEPGYLADILLLDADPLADVRNLSRVRAVIRDGHVIDRAALRASALAFATDSTAR
jgi:imidazolonepropionase-like amidohydrolase